MSHDEDVPPPTAAVQQFLSEHATTGAPSSDELARLRAKVLAHRDAAPTPLRPRRAFLPPEVLAVAALVAVAVVAQLIYLAVRPPPELALATDAGTPEASVRAAWRSGDHEGARLAASSCTDANCASLAARLLRALELTRRFQTLGDDELAELAQLDEALSGGEETELTRAIRERRALPTDPAQLVAEARALEREGRLEPALRLTQRCLALAPGNRECATLDEALSTASAQQLEALAREISALRKEKSFDAAAARAEACAQRFPSAASCYRLLGITYALLATRDGMAADRDRAKWGYERFLELASPDDEFVPKVKALLEQYAETEAEYRARKYPDAGSDQPSEARDLYLRGYMLRESAPDEARALFNEVLSLTAPGSELHEKARHRVDELDGR